MHWPRENEDVLSESTWAGVMPTHTQLGRAGQQSPLKTVFSPQDIWDNEGLLWKGHFITHPIRELRVATKHLGIKDSPWERWLTSAPAFADGQHKASVSAAQLWR